MIQSNTKKSLSLGIASKHILILELKFPLSLIPCIREPTQRNLCHVDLKEVVFTMHRLQLSVHSTNTFEENLLNPVYNKERYDLSQKFIK